MGYITEFSNLYRPPTGRGPRGSGGGVNGGDCVDDRSRDGSEPACEDSEEERWYKLGTHPGRSGTKLHLKKQNYFETRISLHRL
jgi:hypothetical protein